MLDFLLVLGRVPGTEFYFTFSEIMLVLLVIFLRWEEQIRHKQIVRWLKWARYRLGVNYRKSKRIIRSYIKLKRYRLAVWERRQIRRGKMTLRRAYRATFGATYLAYRRLVRRIKLKIRRTKRAIVFASYILPKRKIRLAKMRVRRVRRNAYAAFYRRYRRFNRKFSRLEKRFKNSRIGGISAGVTASIRSSSGH